MSVKDSVSRGVTQVTTHGPVIAHLLRMVQHYGKVQANLHAGAITFFGFLSLFPLLALTFFAVGIVSEVYPAADDQIRTGISSAFPGLLGGGSGISLDQVRTLGGSPWAVAAGAGGVLFTGMGFILVLRTALMFVFEVPVGGASFLRKKLADLLGLVTVGGTLLVSVLLGSVLTRLSGVLLGLVGLGEELAWLLVLLGLGVGFAVNIGLFFVMFRQLGRSKAPARALLGGALLGAIGFEAIKQVSTTLIGLTEGKPAFQAFGIALVVVVVFNYFARVTLYAASWAHTSPSAIAARPDVAEAPVQGPQLPDLSVVTGGRGTGGLGGGAGGRGRGAAARAWPKPFVAGAAAMLGLLAVLKRKDA